MIDEGASDGEGEGASDDEDAGTSDAENEGASDDEGREVSAIGETVHLVFCLFIKTRPPPSGRGLK